MRVFSSSRRCPLCRIELPRCDLRVNLALATACDSLRAFLAVQRRGLYKIFII